MSEKLKVVEIACDEARSVLIEYMEGDLAAEVRAHIDHHLMNCEHCTAVYDGVRNVVELVGSAGSIELPEGFSQRLYKRLLSRTE